jgi:hypothetical protein
MIVNQERNISFEEIVLAIDEGKVKDVIANSNSTKYPHQQTYLVEIQSYIYVVPFVIDREKNLLFLKTIFPSRKLTRKYLGKKEENKTNE